MLCFNIGHLCAARGVEKPVQFLMKMGMSRHRAKKFLDDQYLYFTPDDIEFFCFCFNCEPNDLLRWIPDSKQTYPADFPLKKLERSHDILDLKHKLSKMSHNNLMKIFTAQMDENAE